MPFVRRAQIGLGTVHRLQFTDQSDSPPRQAASAHGWALREKLPDCTPGRLPLEEVRPAIPAEEVFAGRQNVASTAAEVVAGPLGEPVAVTVERQPRLASVEGARVGSFAWAAKDSGKVRATCRAPRGQIVVSAGLAG